MTRLIGLSGYARSGKDTAARTLVGLGWERRAFGDKLRDVLYALDCGLVTAPPDINTVTRLVDRVGWENAKTGYPEVRRLLQRMGTEAGRDTLGPDVWVNAVLDDLPDSTKPPVVVTDVRFPNEWQAIKQRGGIVVRIERPGILPVTSHASETALDGYPFDVTLVNDGTPDDLRVRVHQFISREQNRAA